jgi:hypothetical protein
MLQLPSDFALDDKVLHVEHGEGVIKSIKGTFIVGDPTGEVDLYYEVSFLSGSPLLWIQPSDLRKL